MEQKIEAIKSIGEEIIGLENLERLLTHKKNVVAYDGFEPSGRMHIAQGLLRAHNVNKFVNAGVKFKFWVADWFALMNLKMGGDINKIQKAGKLMIETWKACGMNVDAKDTDGNPMIEFIWSSVEINKRSDEYWKLVLDIGTKFGLTRIRKCTQIMGRKEDDTQKELLKQLSLELDTLDKDNIRSIVNQLLEKEQDDKNDLSASQIFYPVMQCADVFFLGVDIASLGLDQRKVNMLALEYCDKIKRKNKPIIVSHHMIMGLDGSDKMSKSNPDNTIFMDDSEADVKRKITKAFCEPGNIEKNPLLDWTKWLIMPITITFTILDKTYNIYQELEDDFKDLIVHPKDLKNTLITIINQLLEPVRNHFIHNKEINNLLSEVKKFR